MPAARKSRQQHSCFQNEALVFARHTVLWRCIFYIHYWYIMLLTNYYSASYPTRTGNEYRLKFDDALRLGTKKAGWVIPFVETCGWQVKLWSLVDTCQPEHFRDEYRTHYKAPCPVNFIYLLDRIPFEVPEETATASRLPFADTCIVVIPNESPHFIH